MSFEYRLNKKVPAAAFLDGRLEKCGVIHTMQDGSVADPVRGHPYHLAVITPPTESCDFGGYYVLVEKPPAGYGVNQEQACVLYARIDDDGTVESLLGTRIGADAPVLAGLEKAFGVKTQVFGELGEPDPPPLSPFERWASKATKYRQMREQRLLREQRESMARRLRASTGDASDDTEIPF